MGIQAIDLQTLFSQVDKVGKEVAAQREGVAIQQALFGAQLQKKNEERMRSVTAAAKPGEDEQVKQRRRGGRQGEAEGSAASQAAAAAPGGEESLPGELQAFRDPALGKNLDVSM